MSQQGPVIVVSAAGRPSFAAALDETRVFPIIDAGWNDVSRAVETLQPAAVLVAMANAAEPRLEALAGQIAARQPYLPLIAVDPQMALPKNAIPLSLAGGNPDRLLARLRAALRVRTLHATVMRRLDDIGDTPMSSSRRITVACRVRTRSAARSRASNRSGLPPASDNGMAFFGRAIWGSTAISGR